MTMLSVLGIAGLCVLGQNEDLAVRRFLICAFEESFDKCRSETQGEAKDEVPWAEHFFRHHPIMKPQMVVRDYFLLPCLRQGPKEIFLGEGMPHVFLKPNGRLHAAIVIIAEEFLVDGKGCWTARVAEHGNPPRDA